MTQILKSFQLSVTGSTPTTPPSGFGTLYASQSTGLYYKNPTGTEFDLVASNGSIITRYYTGSATGSGVTQTYTWDKPSNNTLKYIEVCCVGAGGGGGSGRKGIISNQSNGGGGGGGGAIAWGFFDANSLSSSYTITIGAGGAGGARQTTNGTNGLAGTSGGTSSFGSLVITAGGGGGPLGQSTQAQAPGGNALNSTPKGFPYAINGCPGSFRNNVPSSPPIGTTLIFDPAFNNVDIIPGYGGGGGGVGGGRNVTLTSGVPATKGSSGYQFTTLIANGGNAGNSGSSGENATPPTDNLITTLLQFTSSVTDFGLGGGGHGGGYGNATTGNGGNGSNGGLYGAGGGGGGATASNTAGSGSGAGGSGSSGLCIVVEFY
jgi:hypothetical protein